MSSPRIVVTGLGGWTPFGLGFDAVRTAVAAGQSALTPMAKRFPSRPELRAGQITDLGPFRKAFPRIKPPLPVPLSRIVMVTVREVLQSAGLLEDPGCSAFGLMLNRNRGPSSVVAKSMLPVMKHGPKKMSPLSFSQSVANAPLGAASVALGLRGPSLLTMGGGALEVAFDTLKMGEAPVVVCGGFEELETHSFRAALDNGVIWPSAEPSTPGLTFAEGAIGVCLETKAHASERGADDSVELLAVERGLEPGLAEPGALVGWGRVSADGLTTWCEAALARAGVAATDLTHHVGGANGHPVIDEAHEEVMARLGAPGLRSPKIKSLMGDGLGFGAALTLAWAASELHNNGRSGVALATHTDFHGQHFAAVLAKRAA